MTLFILYQTDIWKSLTSRIYCGIFDSRNKAKDSAKYNGLYSDSTTAVIVEVEVNLFQEA